MKPLIEFRPKRGSHMAKVMAEEKVAAAPSKPTPSLRRVGLAVQREAVKKFTELTSEPKPKPKTLTHTVVKIGGDKALNAQADKLAKSFTKSTGATIVKPKRKSRAPKAFNRDEYQTLYMRDRRAADAAGFGKGPNFKTVSQYREWKAGQKDGKREVF